MIPQNKKGGVVTKKSSIFTIILVLILVITFTLCTTPHIFYFYSFPTHQHLNYKDYQICYRGEPVTLIARIQNETDPIVGELALFYDTTNGMMIGGAYTNSSGYAVLEWGIPNNHSLGLAIINASCPSRPDAIPVYIDLFIKARTNFGNLTHTTSAYPGEILIAEADLRDDANSSLPDQLVCLFNHQNVSLNASATDSSGHCVLSWLVPSGLAPGVYSFYLRFEGNQTYGSAESVFNVTTLPRDLKIVSVILNATFVKPNELIYVVVEISSSDPLVSVRIDGFLLEKASETSWIGAINASSQPGRHVLSVVVYYNGVECINDSATYYVGEEKELGAPLWPLLLLLTNGQEFLSGGLTVIVPLSLMAIFSAGLALKRRNRQPGFSRDYTIDVDLDSP